MQLLSKNSLTSSELSQEILRINREKSREFVDCKAVRRDYRKSHFTEFAVSGCMDSRVPLNFGLPTGIITPFRSRGGIHDLGWDKFRRSLESWSNHARAKNRFPVLIVTYHWSRSTPWLGCKGFNYDLQSAINRMSEFRHHVASRYRGEILPIMVGMETDTNGFVIHSPKGETLDLGLAHSGIGKHFLEEKIQNMFAEFPKGAVKDLTSLFLSNVQHINNNEAKLSKPLDHGEYVLAIGDYLEWLPFGLALKLGLHDPFLDRSVVTAVSIIRDNLLSGRISDSGVLFISVPYWQSDQRQTAIVQSKSLFQIASRSIRENYPDMWKFFNPLVGVMNLSTNRFEEIRF